MRRWRPKFAFGPWFGLLLLLLTLAGVWYLGQRLVLALSGTPQEWPITLNLYANFVALLALLLLLAALAYRLVAVFTLTYEIDRNGVYISWSGHRAIVPLNQIEHLDIGTPGARIPWRLIQGIGGYWGQGRTANGQPLHLFATRPPRKCLLLQTSDAVYAISPAAQEAFVQDLEQRRKLGVVKPLAAKVETSRLLAYAFWNDRIARRALVLAFSLNLLMLGILAARYPNLAVALPLQFDVTGQPIDLRPRHHVLLLPLAAFLVSVCNVVVGIILYQHERIGVQLLQLASVLTQVLFGVVIIAIVLRF